MVPLRFRVWSESTLWVPKAKLPRLTNMHTTHAQYGIQKLTLSWWTPQICMVPPSILAIDPGLVGGFCVVLNHTPYYKLVGLCDMVLTSMIPHISVHLWMKSHQTFASILKRACFLFSTWFIVVLLSKKNDIVMLWVNVHACRWHVCIFIQNRYC